MNGLKTEDLLLIGAIYGGIVLVAFWLAMVIWCYRDVKARTRDALPRLLMPVLVAVLNVGGLLIYLFLRPRETLAEAYERSLEEEALLQEIEEKPVCPTCGIRTQDNWQVCPSCHTKLKKPCVHCGRVLELSWGICPYCAASQGTQSAHDWQMQSQYQPSQPASIAATVHQQEGQPNRDDQYGALEFIDGDDYQ